MKIRSGFVSNSSSSSFTCDVCGDTESGMDCSPRDFDMETCVNGHTFCLSHAEGLSEPTPESMKKEMVETINADTYLSESEKKIQLKEVAELEDDEVEDYYESEGFRDDGVSECNCPVCMLTTIADSDGYKYLLKKQGLTKKTLLKVVKDEFKTYKAFNDYTNPPGKK
jgi:hypothetical protein